MKDHLCYRQLGNPRESLIRRTKTSLHLFKNGKASHNLSITKATPVDFENWLRNEDIGSILAHYRVTA